MVKPEIPNAETSPDETSRDVVSTSRTRRWSSRIIVVAFLVFVAWLLGNVLLVRHLAKPKLVAVDLIGHKKGVNDITFSYDGTLVATASDDKTMRLWSTASGDAIRTFQGHSKRITQVKFRPFGGEIATASDDQTIRIWDLETGIEVRSLRGHEAGITALEFSPDAATLITCGNDKTIRIWNYADGAERLKIDAGAVMKCVAVHPIDPLLATGGWDKKVRIIDTGTGEEVSVMDGHWGVVEAVAFSPDGRLLCSASRDETLRLWDVESGKPSLSINSHDAAVYGVCFTADGEHVVSCDWNGLVLVHHAQTGDEVTALVVYPNSVLCIDTHPSESMIASGGYGASAILWKE